MSSPQEDRPHTESENVCINCTIPQEIPLSPEELCFDCFFYRREFGSLPDVTKKEET